jgi:formylglycine-generating enzyme required for sulfatase activity
MSMKYALRVAVLFAALFAGQATAVEVTLELVPGWNLVSVPVLATDPSPAVVFAGVEVSSVWEWNAETLRYRVPTELVPGRAYWVYHPGTREGTATTVQIEGAAPAKANVYLGTGWSLVGPVPGYQRLATTGVGSIQGWNAVAGVYADIVGETYQTGQGCWMYAAEPTVVDFSTYTLRGTVTGEVVENVTVVLTGTVEAQSTSAADGTFQFTGLRTGVYRVTPSTSVREAVTFAPGSRESILVDGADVAGVVFDSTDSVADTSALSMETPGFQSSTTDAFAVKANVQTLAGAGVTVNAAEQTITLSSQRRDAVSVGDVLIGDETTRFAKVVTALETVDGNTVLSVEDANLEQILDVNGSFAFRVTPDWSTSRRVPGRGVLQKPMPEYFTQSTGTRSLDGGDVDGNGLINLDNVSLLDLKINANGSVDWPNSTLMGDSLDPQSAGDSVHEGQFEEGRITADLLTGTLNVTPTFDLEFGVNLGGPWAKGTMDVKIVVELEVRVAVTASAGLHLSGALMPKLSVPISIPTPAGVPIHLDIELDIPAGIKLEADGAASLTFRQRNEYTVHADLDYDCGNPLQITKKIDKTYGVREIVPVLEGRISAEVYLEPTVKVKIYKIVGPYVWVHPYIRGEVSYPLLKNRDELFVGINGGLGLELDTWLFGTYDVKSGPLFDLSLSWDLLGPEDAGSVNTPPQALPQTTDVSNATATNIGLTLTGVDADGDRLRYGISSYPEHGSLSSLDPNAGTMRYYPHAGYCGTDAFSFTVDDGVAASMPATVTLNVVANQAPTARFTANAQGLVVAFDASASTDPEDAVGSLQVCWDFEGNGAWTDWSTTKTSNHTFPRAGTYVARCQVRDTAGVIRFWTRVLGLDASETNTMPVADLRFSVNGLTVTLDLSHCTDAEDDASGTPLEYQWTWSRYDSYCAWGTTATGQHTYSQPGTYEVYLRVRDSDGNVVDAMSTVMGDYLVIDLSTGPSATSYPVSYLPTVPAGGWPDEYKTTKLVLRRIPAGAFIMGSPVGELGRSQFSDETQHQVTLTKGLYIGVFEVTQKQWERVMGYWWSRFYNAAYRDTRPVEMVSYSQIRGSTSGAAWPVSNSVDAYSFMGILRQKTGVEFDLPTEAQWEYACRAGTTTALNSGRNLTATGLCWNMAEVGRYSNNGGPKGWFTSQMANLSEGTAGVGSYLPNAWGLYDMHGNVFEWCLDWCGGNLNPGTLTNPGGPAAGSLRTYRGGSWISGPGYCRSASRGGDPPAQSLRFVGFRLVRVIQ